MYMCTNDMYMYMYDFVHASCKTATINYVTTVGSIQG